MHLEINKGADRGKVAKDSWSYTPTKQPYACVSPCASAAASAEISVLDLLTSTQLHVLSAVAGYSRLWFACLITHCFCS